MWVYDGDEWTRDEEEKEQPGRSDQQQKRPPYDEMTPELQVIEIVPVRRDRNVPPFPII